MKWPWDVLMKVYCISYGSYLRLYFIFVAKDLQQGMWKIYITGQIAFTGFMAKCIKVCSTEVNVCLKCAVCCSEYLSGID
jgi:hypothetical protein